MGWLWSRGWCGCIVVRDRRFVVFLVVRGRRALRCEGFDKVPLRLRKFRIGSFFLGQVRAEPPKGSAEGATTVSPFGADGCRAARRKVLHSPRVVVSFVA